MVKNNKKSLIQIVKNLIDNKSIFNKEKKDEYVYIHPFFFLYTSCNA